MEEIKGELISFSRGAQFRGGKSAYGFVGMLFMILVAVGLSIQGHYSAAGILSILVVLTFFHVFDFRGVQVQKDKNKVREYQLKLWGKTGKWLDFAQFSTVSLEYESFEIRTSDLLEDEGSTIERHRHFLVSLECQDSGKKILLAEIVKYREAEVFAREAARSLGLECVDRFGPKLQASRRKQRR